MAIQYLLLQVRNPDDTMRDQEVFCFARALKCHVDQISRLDLLTAAPNRRQLDSVDMVLLGGSGHYSAIGNDDWLLRALESLQEIHEMGKPTFASCFGFQAMARALGGRVEHDLAHAELGSIDLRTTTAGQNDPLFSQLGRRFLGLAGHEDRVVELPAGAQLLASSEQVRNQAYRFSDRPIYCTQFHPELRRDDLLDRLRAYPEYAEKIAGVSFDQLVEQCKDTLQAEALLPSFVRHVFGEEVT